MANNYQNIENSKNVGSQLKTNQNQTGGTMPYSWYANTAYNDPQYVLGNLLGNLLMDHIQQNRINATKERLKNDELNANQTTSGDFQSVLNANAGNKFVQDANGNVVYQTPSFQPGLYGSSQPIQPATFKDYVNQQNQLGNTGLFNYQNLLAQAQNPAAQTAINPASYQNVLDNAAPRMTMDANGNMAYNTPSLSLFNAQPLGGNNSQMAIDGNLGKYANSNFTDELTLGGNNLKSPKSNGDAARADVSPLDDNKPNEEPQSGIQTEQEQKQDEMQGTTQASDQPIKAIDDKPIKENDGPIKPVEPPIKENPQPIQPISILNPAITQGAQLGAQELPHEPFNIDRWKQDWINEQRGKGLSDYAINQILEGVSPTLRQMQDEQDRDITNSLGNIQQPNMLPTLDNQSQLMANTLVQYKQAYDKAKELGKQDVMDNVAQKAQALREAAAQSGIDLSAFDGNVSANQAAANLAGYQQNAVANQLRGLSTNEYYQQIVDAVKNQGYGDETANRIATQMANRYQSQRAQQLQNAFLAYGVNKDSNIINDFGMQAIMQLANEDPSTANVLAKAYGMPSTLSKQWINSQNNQEKFKYSMLTDQAKAARAQQQNLQNIQQRAGLASKLGLTGDAALQYTLNGKYTSPRASTGGSGGSGGRSSGGGRASGKSDITLSEARAMIKMDDEWREAHPDKAWASPYAEDREVAEQVIHNAYGTGAYPDPASIDTAPKAYSVATSILEDNARNNYPYSKEQLKQMIRKQLPSDYAEIIIDEYEKNGTFAEYTRG